MKGLEYTIFLNILYLTVGNGDVEIPESFPIGETARHAASVGGGKWTGVDAGFESRGGLEILRLGHCWSRFFLGVRAEWETGRVGDWLCTTGDRHHRATISPRGGGHLTGEAATVVLILGVIRAGDLTD